MKGERTGDIAEDMAVDFLRLEGYTILARNYRYGKAELDIVARRDDGVAFVEVKLRDAGTAGASPLEAVGPKKRQLMLRAATHYVVSHGIDQCTLSFDVIAIEWDRTSRQVRIVHLCHAFDSNGSYYL